jgi:hypothetical protein
MTRTMETAKTYNSGYSLVVTHLTTNPPVRCLNRAERTGSLVFNVLWLYVEHMKRIYVYDGRILQVKHKNLPWLLKLIVYPRICLCI